MTRRLAIVAALVLLMTACVASTTGISRAELPISSAELSAQDDATATQTPTPTVTPTPTSIAVVDSAPFPLMSAQDWCAGAGLQIRDTMLFTTSSDDLAPLAAMIEALRSTMTGSPPEISDAVFTALLSFEELHEILLVGDTVSIDENDPDYWSSRNDFFDALFDIEEYNFEVCGLDPARGLRPTPTPTPDPVLEDFWILVEELLEEGFTEEESRCLAGLIIDEDVDDLDDDALLEAILSECLS